MMQDTNAGKKKGGKNMLLNVIVTVQAADIKLFLKKVLTFSVKAGRDSPHNRH